MKNRYVVSFFSFVTGVIVWGILVIKNMKKEVEQNRILAYKHLVLYQLMNEWVHIKQEGKSLSEYFEKNGYKNIAIYGMNFVGKTLMEEFKDTDINICYAIDRDADRIYMDIEMKKPDDELSEVDAIVVTPITYFDEIEAVLQKKVNCPIISIDDIIYDI